MNPESQIRHDSHAISDPEQSSREKVSRQLLVICEYCDAVHRRPALLPHEKAMCQRCGQELYRDNRRAYRRMLPLVLAALILFVISNTFPIVDMDLQGVRTHANLWTAVMALHRDDMNSVAVLVFCTTILFPLMELLLLLYVLIPLASHRLPAGFNLALRVILMSRPWCMLEVFMVGVLVSAVKLSTLASVVPDVALWSYGALVLLLASILSFDLRYLWQIAEETVP